MDNYSLGIITQKTNIGGNLATTHLAARCCPCLLPRQEAKEFRHKQETEQR